MPNPARILLVSISASSAAVLFGATGASAQVQQPPSSGDRVLGLDVSAWQQDISQATWNDIRNVENRQFVFIRSSRGGTTGYYNQSNPDNIGGENTLSQRYDDPYFAQNITRATNAGMLAGPYHFGRLDIISSTLNSGGIPNNGADEADHFIQMAGAWMRPGYLLPTFDLEAGIPERNPAQLTQFSLDFSNRINEVMGIRPIIYINGTYANRVESSAVAAFPNMWIARWPNQENPGAINVQTGQPDDSLSSLYGKWDDFGDPQPWKFWQYTSWGRLNSFNSGGSNLDLNVAQGNIEFVKDYQVPALWTSPSDGNWVTMSNWNSGQNPAAPVQGPGQVARVGTLDLPVARLPGLQDNVDINRPNENITVTLDRGYQSVRRFNLNERLNVSGGALNASLSGQVGAGGTLSLSGGNVHFTQAYVNNGGLLDFSGAGTLHVGTLFLESNPTFTGAGGTGQILAKAGYANPTLNLMGGTRSFAVADGSAGTDMRIVVPLTNGHFTKTGTGTLELTGNNSAFAGNLFVSGGNLRLTNANQIGTSGVRTSSSGAVLVDGNGLNFTREIRLGGRGFGNAGALQNVAGNNTWSGNVVLNGGNHNQNETRLNQISAADGTTLNLSGVIENNLSAEPRSWAKIGGGDVVLTGNSPNTYSNLTRVFNGRLIIEKDAALGATNQTEVAAGTLQLPNANSVVAFRAPTGSSGLNYTAQEWIFTDGLGVNNAQIDNLGGANTFAGHFGLAGPVGADGVQKASIGVSTGSLELTGGLYARGTSGSTGPEARHIHKRGNGTLILSGTNVGGPSNSFARPLADRSTFTIEAGTVQLKGAAGNGVNVAGISTWNVNTGGLLALAQGDAAGSADVQFNGNVSGNGNLAKSGSGSVFLGGAVSTFGGAMSVTGGTLGIAQSGADSSIANVNGISIGGSARLDLADNDLVVRTTPAAGMEAFVAAGYADGDWNGTGGIISSTAADDDWIHTLGVADNALLGRESFGGHAGLTGDETFVMYTIYGDADLTGAVDPDDFDLFRAGFAGEQDAVWHFGDFDYNGIVNGLDFERYLFGFLNQPSSNAPAGFYGELVTFAEDNGLDPTMIPEPSSVALLAMGAGVLLRRRRR